MGPLVHLVLTTSAIAASPGPGLSRTFSALSVDQGLSQSTVYSIVQDKKGLLWFGTGDGLNRYDGYVITTYRHVDDDSVSLPGNIIRSLCVDTAGTLWIGSNKGVAWYDPVTGSFHAVSLPARWPRNEWTEMVWLVADPEGGILIGTHGNGVLKFALGMTEPLRIAGTHAPITAAADEIEQIAVSGDLVWIARANETLCAIDRRKGISQEFRVPDRVMRLCAGEDGTCLIGTREGSLWRTQWPNTDVVRLPVTTEAIQKSRRAAVFAICPDGAGGYWLGTDGGGFVRLDAGGKMTERHTADGGKNGLTSEIVRAILRDRSGILWLGTDGGGVNKLNVRSPKFSVIRHISGERASLEKDFLRSVLEDHERIVWIGAMDGGLTRVDRRTNSFTVIRHDPGSDRTLSSNTVGALFEDRAGRVWAGTDRGLDLVERKNGNVTRFAVPWVMRVAAIAEDSGGTLYVGGPRGIGMVDIEARRVVPVELRAPGGNRTSVWTPAVTTLFKDHRGTLWVGTNGAGFTSLDSARAGGAWFLHDPANPSSIGSNVVYSIAEDDSGLLWVGTREGLNQYARTTGALRRFTMRDGLANDYVYGLETDHRGALWISTNHGLSRLNLATHHFRNFELADGLQSYEFNSGAYARGPSGELFFGGIAGLNAFFPDSIVDNPIPPQVVMTQFRLYDREPGTPADVSDRMEFRLAWGENIFTIQFAGLEYTDPSRNTYMYIMEGFEKSWTRCGTRRDVRYTQLNPGTYTFRVKAANSDGVWSEPGLAVKIVIVPPFWREGWFLAIVVVAILALIAGSVRFVALRKLKKKIRLLEQQRALDNERTRISKDMHDDVGASLTRILLLSEVARGAVQNPAKTEENIEKILTTARGVIGSLDEIVWAVNPKNDSLDNLANYVLEYAGQFLEPTQFRCRFDFPDTIPTHPLPADLRYNVFLCIKEALTNVVRYATPGEVRLSLSADSTRATWEVCDEGPGFTLEAVGRFSNGVENMRKRMHAVGGECVLLTAPGNGTRVRFIHTFV